MLFINNNKTESLKREAFIMDMLKLKHPFTCYVAGPTGSGKTMLIRDILRHNHVTLTPNFEILNVLWLHGQWQDIYKEPIGSNVITTYIEGLPTEDAIMEIKPNVIVFDDLLTELANSGELANFFTKKSHHLNISVFFLTQNLFPRSPIMRTVSLNSHYIILLKNPRDQLQIMSLARQIYPSSAKFLLDAYKDATSRPFGYLLVDLKPDTDDRYRLRTNILRKAGRDLIIYAPKGYK